MERACATGVTLPGSGCRSGWRLPPRSRLQWDRTEQEDPVRGEADTHTLSPPHQRPSAPTLPSYLLRGVECVKACLCLWCSIKRPARRTPLSEQCSLLNLFLFIFCWCCWDFSAFSRSTYKTQSDWMMASLPDLRDIYKVHLEQQTVHDFEFTMLTLQETIYSLSPPWQQLLPIRIRTETLMVFWFYWTVFENVLQHSEKCGFIQSKTTLFLIPSQLDHVKL